MWGRGDSPLFFAVSERQQRGHQGGGVHALEGYMILEFSGYAPPRWRPWDALETPGSDGDPLISPAWAA